MRRPGGHPEGRVDVGDQPRPRDGQAIDGTVSRGGGGHARRRGRTGRRNSGLPVDQHHALRQADTAASQPVEVDPGRHRPTGRIRGVPASRVVAGRLHSVDQRRDALSPDVEDLQPYVSRGRQLEGDDRGRIERIRIIRPQIETIRHRREC